MSSFFILSIACTARLARSVSLWPSSSPRTRGTICQDTPKRSFSQPHGPCSPPPAISFVEYSASPDDLAKWVGPNLQRYFSAELGDQDDDRPVVRAARR